MTEVTNDQISRRMAIDEMCKMMYECFRADEEELDAIKTTLNELPTVQSKQVCVATVTLTDEQVKEAVEKAKNAIISVIEPEPHWIPCRKKLPEKVGAYLVQALMNDDIFVARWEGCYWGVKTPIIAWMPLPEPYKGGDKE